MGFLFILIVGLIAGTISGIVGTGSSIMLMPVLVFEYGPKQAVPIMAIAAVLANLSRILAWWREVDWRACAAYSVTGIPAAALGARTLLALPAHAVDIAIGLFLIAMVPVRHWLARHELKANLWHLALGGAIGDHIIDYDNAAFEGAAYDSAALAMVLGLLAVIGERQIPPVMLHHRRGSHGDQGDALVCGTEHHVENQA